MPYKTKEARRAHYAANKERFSTAAREYYADHAEKICDIQRIRYSSDPERWCAYAAARRHGLTPEQFEHKRMSQNDCCGCCGDKFTATPNTDHDHSCCPPQKSCDKCRRDLLCRDCNFGLGFFKDSPLRLQQAIGYLAKYGREIIKGEGPDA